MIMVIYLVVSFFETINHVNGCSASKWELVEEETTELTKEEKTLLEIVIEHLGVQEGEEFIAKAREDNIKRFMFDVWE